MAGLGQFASGAIQFDEDTGAIERRGAYNRSPSAPAPTPATPAAPSGGGVLPAFLPSTPAPVGDTGLPGGTSYPNSMFDTGDWNGHGFGGAAGAVGRWDRARGAGDFVNSLRDGSFGGGGPDGTGGAVNTLSAFAEGGEVGGQPDAMSVIREALAFGRQQMGLPTNFDSGEMAAPSFEEGGVVPTDEGGYRDGNAGGGLPDPQATLHYLTGDGGVSPEIALALEQRVDPQGTLDPEDRMLAAVQAAPTPEARFGMLQHYRTKFNAYSGGARAALARGDLGQAAMNATKAFANVPTGKKVRFAPAQGGLAVMTKPVGGARPQQPAFEDGGFADRLDGVVPASDSIEDRRDEPEYRKQQTVGNATRKYANEFVEGLKVIKARTKKGLGYEDDSGPSPDEITRDFGEKTKGYEDGGEVEDDEEGVIPTEGGAPEPEISPQSDFAQAEPDPSLTDGPVPPPEGGGEPIMLTPEQFNKLMTAGYDKPIDRGWGGLISSIAGALGPSSAQAAELPPEQRGGVTSVGKTDRLPVSPALQKQMDTPTPLTQVEQGRQREQAEAEPGRLRGQRWDEQVKRIEQMADKLFPWVGQTPQRNAYVAQMLEKFQGDQGRVEQEHARGRGNVEFMKEQGRNQRLQMQEEGRNARQQRAAQSRLDQAQINGMWRNLNSQQQAQVRMLGQQLAADPSLAGRPGVAAQRVQQLSESLRIDPDALKQMMQTPGIGVPGGAGGGQRPPGADMGAVTVGTVRPYTKNGVTRNYKFGADGMWHLMPQ